MTGIIIDTAQTLSLAQYRALKANVSAVIRYLDRLDPNGAKNFKIDEARAAAEAGMPIMLVFEMYGTPSGASQAALDSSWVRSYVPTVGFAPGSGLAIANAVDEDATAAMIQGIVDYFKVWTPGIAPYRAGAYGSGFVVSTLDAQKLISLRWIACSSGWAGTRAVIAACNYDMDQFLSPQLEGIDVDVNRLRDPTFDFGARVPFAASPPVAPAIAAKTPSEIEAIINRVKEIFS